MGANSATGILYASRRPKLAALLTQQRIYLPLIFFTALALRIGLVLLMKTYVIAPGDGFEMRNIARSLAEGHGYSSPFGVPSGPTAWAAPLFPAILAACFKMFGAFTVSSAVAIRLINCILSALCCVFVYLAADPVFGRRSAMLSGLVFVFYPPSIWTAIRTTWDTTLLSLLLLVMMCLLVRLPGRQSLAYATTTGAAVGVLLLDNVAPLVVLPFLLVWYIWYTRGPWWGKQVSILVGLPLLIFGPWIVRNYISTGSLVTRCCAGIELLAGNNEDSWQRRVVTTNVTVHPAGSAAELKLYLSLGEKAYEKYSRARALEFLRSNPKKGLDLFVWKIEAWWLDLHTDEGQEEGDFGAFVRKGKQAVRWAVLPLLILGVIAVAKARNRLSYPYLVMVFVYPVPYYIFWVGEHVHVPVEAFVITLASYGLLVLIGSAHAPITSASPRPKPNAGAAPGRN